MATSNEFKALSKAFSGHNINGQQKATSNEFHALTKAFSGLGVDEKSFITILGKWDTKQRQFYRKNTQEFFKEDERQFERWDEAHVLQVRQEFLRLKDAVVVYTMHPWERDARLIKEALVKEAQPQHHIIIETAATRSSEQLLGARRAYHSLFEHSIEEDIASHIHTPERNLLVGLVSSYRYEGPRVDEELAKSEAKEFLKAIKDSGKKELIEDEEIVRILSTRSKLHLKALYSYYKQISGNYFDEELGGSLILKQTVECLCTPQTYFSKILDASLRLDVDEPARDSVTRVIATRVDEDIKQIAQEFHKRNGTTLTNKIEEIANGSYKEFLLALVAKSA
ncbi:annexin D4-like [Nicotiana tabacum]|uniref:Annexin D4-like n=2 Tax=Nicotiana TaxID=4085 RepID=A0A1S3X4U3_TOBAC|nr:PREDICTED: annexin D4-like isoform X1 [Nicotiana sylvestris]XP_016434728.1 PREDICTED: annexin D4-like isoform X1 [Nicotiana tabacum]